MYSIAYWVTRLCICGHLFSINNNTERIYEKLLRDYKYYVQLCVTNCAVKLIERFDLTAEEYVELVNNIIK